MPLLQCHIEELKRIHRAETGETLSDAEAWVMAHRMVALLRILSGHGQEYGGSDRRSTTTMNLGMD